MRQTHLAGEKLFVDWADDTAPVIDPMTGEVHEPLQSARCRNACAIIEENCYGGSDALLIQSVLGCHLVAKPFLSNGIKRRRETLYVVSTDRVDRACQGIRCRSAAGRA
jgi:hypothetical protein